MNLASKIFIEELNRKDIHYQEHNNRGVRVTFRGEKKSNITLVFFFDDEGEHVEIYSWSIASVPPEKRSAILEVCNKLNYEYRWGRFYIDKDNEVAADMHAIITTSTIGSTCTELMFRMINVIDDAYPTIMTALWN